MRTLLFLAGILFTTVASAQPVVYKAFDYQIGDSIRYVVCDTQNFIAGDGGVNKVWQFGQLSKDGDTWMKIIPASSAAYPNSFPTANFVELYPDGSEIYRQHTANGYYITGVANGMYLIKYPDAQLLFQNPMGFASTSTDTFKSSYFAGAYQVRGIGTVQFTADAYGDLVLPDTTYNSVLRVRMEMIQTDTLIGWPGNNLIISQTTTYLWFDTAHKAALLKADSIKIETPFGNTQRASVMYLKEPAKLKIESDSREDIAFNCAIMNDEIIVRGDFNDGEKYTLQVYDAAGRWRITKHFHTTGKSTRLKLQQELPSGTYIVKLANSTSIASRQVYKFE